MTPLYLQPENNRRLFKKMHLIRLLLSLLIPLVIGLSLLKILFPKKYLPKGLTIALGYGCGAGILTQWMLMIGGCGLGLTLANIALPLIIISALLLWISRMKNKQTSLHPNLPFYSLPDSSLKTAKEKMLGALLCIFILYYLVIIIWRAVNIPVYEWDVIATIAFKARVFFFDSHLVAPKHLPHSSYPLHVSLLETWTAISIGEWNDQLIKLIFPVFCASYLIVHYYFLRFFTNALWALIGTALTVSAHQFVSYGTIGYQEIVMLYYNCCAVIILAVWAKTRNTEFLILASLLSGFVTFTKLEGMGYLWVHATLVALILLSRKDSTPKNKLTSLGIYLVPCISIYLLYMGYKIISGTPLTERVGVDFSFSHLNRIPEIFSTWLNLLFFSGNWNILWFLLAVSFLNLLNRKWSEEIRIVTIGLGLFFGLYFVLSVVNTSNYLSLVHSDAIEAFPRVVLHFFPLSTFLIALLNCPRKE